MSRVRVSDSGHAEDSPQRFLSDTRGQLTHDALDRLADVEPSVTGLVGLRYLVGRILREAAEDLDVALRRADAWWV